MKDDFNFNSEYADVFVATGIRILNSVCSTKKSALDEYNRLLDLYRKEFPNLVSTLALIECTCQVDFSIIKHEVN